MTFTEPVASIDMDGVHVTSEEVARKLEKKNISPSLISSLEKCPAQWFSDSFVIRDLIEEEPDNAARRGSLYHKVMENFFALPPEERTKLRIKEEVDNVLASDEFKDMTQYPEAIQWLRQAINNYYSMGAKPELVQIATVKDKEEREHQGLEVFVKGRLGNSKRDTLGFIDRLVKDTRKTASPDAVVVEDWKTGGTAKRWNPKTKSDEGLGEARQQTIYTMLLESNYGKEVAGARLIFPMALDPKWKADKNKDESKPQYLPTVVDVPALDEDFRKRVISDVEEADAKLDIFIDRNTFEFQPNFLCAWCPLVRLCPKATVKPYAKMQAAYAQQPDAELLLQGFELL